MKPPKHEHGRILPDLAPNRLSPYAARARLRDFGVDPRNPPDFHTLRQSQVESVLRAADARRYRQPKNANGSRARYFYSYCVRQARKDEDE